jgi:predicted dehydrogenase
MREHVTSKATTPERTHEEIIMASEKKVRWGVIGSGGIARRRTIPEGIVPSDLAELACVFDTSAELNQEVASEFSCEAAGSEDELLARGDVDAVYIATPAYLHYQQVLDAAATGKHVFCEKPLGLNAQQTQEMISACKSAGVSFGAGFMMRFHACHQEALKIIRDGRLGTPVLGRAQLSCWFPPMEDNWRQDPTRGGGGSLMDLGGHTIDLLEMFFGEVRSVFCRTGHLVHDYASEDSATVLLEFDNGAHGMIDAFFCMPDAASQNRLELYGSQGSLLAEGTIGQGAEGSLLANLEEPGKAYDAQQSRAEDGGMVLTPDPVNTYRAEIDEFSRAILQGRPAANDASLGLRSAKILDACYQSAKTSQMVTIK